LKENGGKVPKKDITVNDLLTKEEKTQLNSAFAAYVCP
jgi:hypothetical protein